MGLVFQMPSRRSRRDDLPLSPPEMTSTAVDVLTIARRSRDESIYSRIFSLACGPNIASRSSLGIDFDSRAACLRYVKVGFCRVTFDLNGWSSMMRITWARYPTVWELEPAVAHACSHSYCQCDPEVLTNGLQEHEPKPSRRRSPFQQSLVERSLSRNDSRCQRFLHQTSRLVSTSIRHIGSAYNHFHAILAVFLQQKRGEASGTVALLSTPFFVKPNREYDGPAWSEVAFEKAVDGCQHGDEVGLIILGATPPDVLSVVVTIKWRVSPFGCR